MDLLFICQEYPFPPRNGIRLKLFNVLSFIARRHQCDVLAFDDVTDEQLGMARDLASPEVRVLGIHRPAGGAALRLAQLGRFVTGRRLPSAARWTTQSYSAAVHNALARGYDVIHYDMANVTGYASLATGTPAVFSINDSLSRYFELESQNPSIGMLRRVVDRRLAAIARSTERDEYPRAHAVHVVSEEERAHLERSAGLSNVQVIPIAVEQAYFDLQARTHGGTPVTILAAGNVTLPSIAVPLMRFVSIWWPRSNSWVPTAHLVIAGSAPAPRRIHRCLGKSPRVSYLPWIHTYIDVLERADVALFLDSRAGGMKNRVAQALAGGRAVVGTAEALEGIKGTPGADYLVARNSEEALAHVRALVTQEDLRRRISDNGRKVAKRHYTQEVIGLEWEALYERLARKRGHRR